MKIEVALTPSSFYFRFARLGLHVHADRRDRGEAVVWIERRARGFTARISGLLAYADVAPPRGATTRLTA
jgi:hypothetical protein